MPSSLTGALRGALDDVIAECTSGRFGQVDLTMFSHSVFREQRDQILDYLFQASGGRIVPGDSRLYHSRLGMGIYFVYLPQPDPANPLRPEYQPGARCLYIAGSDWGLYDCGGPADKAKLAQTAPDGLPADYVLPDWVK